MVEYYQDVIVPGFRKVIEDQAKRQSEIGNCDGCYWKEKVRRPSRCSCCRRNRDMKDNYRRAEEGGRANETNEHWLCCQNEQTAADAAAGTASQCRQPEEREKHALHRGSSAAAGAVEK